MLLHHFHRAAWLVLCCVGAMSTLAGTAAPQAQTRPAINNMFPEWSADGKQIAFVSDRDGDPEIYVMDADGSHPRRLTNTPGRDAHPSFSRDGRRILFQSPRGDGHTNIYSMNADGSDARPLTFLKGFAGVPVYSPDGSQISFMWRMSSDFADSSFKWLFGVMRADGSKLRILTDGQANDQVPNWSRDGKRLLFFSDRTGKDQIYTMRADGSDVRRLLTSDGNDSTARWSPDGKQIAFTSDRDGNTELYVMDSKGRNLRRLTHTPGIERGPNWSPDGQLIAFTSEHDGGSDIFVIRPDGSALRRL